MTNEDLEQLEALVAAMTPGPWRINPMTPFQIVEDRDGGYFLGVATVPERSWSPANAAAIVALVNAAPALLSDHRRLTAELAEAVARAEVAEQERDDRAESASHWCTEEHFRTKERDRAIERIAEYEGQAADLLLMIDGKLDETFAGGATMRRCRVCSDIVVGGPTVHRGCAERDAARARLAEREPLARVGEAYVAWLAAYMALGRLEVSDGGADARRKADALDAAYRAATTEAPGPEETR